MTGNPAQMLYCPNCSSTVAPSPSVCGRCKAEFGPNSSWAPTAALTKSSQTLTEVQRTPTELFLVRLAATVWLVIATLLSIFPLAMLTTLSLPIGMLNAPLRGPLIIPLLYIFAALFSLIQLWMTKPYTTLYLVVATFPFYSWTLYAAVLYMLP